MGVSPSVIRAWEKLGVARPQRSSSRYRLYSAEDLKLLKRARFLRKARGMNAASHRATAETGRTRHFGRAMEVPAQSGAHLRKLRAKRGLSLARVARAVGISVGFLERSPSVRQMSGLGRDVHASWHGFTRQAFWTFLMRPMPAACKCIRQNEEDSGSRPWGKDVSSWPGATR